MLYRSEQKQEWLRSTQMAGGILQRDELHPKMDGSYLSTETKNATKDFTETEQSILRPPANPLPLCLSWTREVNAQ